MEKLFENISLNEHRQNTQFIPVEIKKDEEFIKQMIICCNVYETWGKDILDGYIKSYELEELESYSSEYVDLEEEFQNSIGAGGFLVAKIVRVKNPYLILQYELKLQQKKRIHGEVVESRLYHGTKRCNIESICGNNFDWRKLGANGMRSSKFGQGVSFSPDICYASDYPRRCFEDPRIMFVANVLEVSRCEGDDSMEIPPLPHDTSADLRGNKVVVKYFDNEYYPEYIVYYTMP